MTLLGLKQFQGNSINRSIASDCQDMVLSLIKQSQKSQLPPMTKDESLAHRHFQFKKSIWSKILKSSDFENFNDEDYFRILELYQDPQTAGNLLRENPVSIEHKMALLEAIELRFNHFHSLPSIMDEVEHLSAFKLKRLQQLLKKFDLSSNLTRQNLDEFSSEFFLILKGPPSSAFLILTQEKSKRSSDRMLRVLQEDLLIRGLKGVIASIPEKKNYTQIEAARIFIKKVMKYKAWRFFVMPYDLPWIDQVKISDQLLEKILLDGLAAHQSELVKELKHQNLIDHYERIRKLYRPVAFGVGFYYYYTKYQSVVDKQEEENAEEAKKKFLEDLAKIADAIKENTGEAERSESLIKQMQFKRLLDKYRETYHMEPTPEEYEELKKKVFKLPHFDGA